MASKSTKRNKAIGRKMFILTTACLGSMMPCGFGNTLVSRETCYYLFLCWKPLVVVLLKTSNLGIAVSPVFMHSRLIAFVHNIPSHDPSKKVKNQTFNIDKQTQTSI
jgi:hypothetical protein